MPLLILIAAALLALPSAAAAQCCGDCNGDGEVTINELITAVNSALGQCVAGPTPTALPTDECPIDFSDDNTRSGTPDCFYIGRWNPSCGAADLESLWRSDGEIVIVDILGAQSDLFFVGGEVTGTNTANIIGWFIQPDASDLQDLAGTMTLGSRGTTLAVDPNTPPVNIDGDCAFSQYRGALDDVQVPAAATAALRRRAVDPAALARVRAALQARPRPQLRRH